MYNDFVLIGPKADPAKVAGGKDVARRACAAIAEAKAPFVSRGDNSGTHAAELRICKDAGVDLATRARATWYREIGPGMGPALNTASSMNAYVLADRGTWLAFKNRGDLGVVVEGDRKLFNPYGVMLVNPGEASRTSRRRKGARSSTGWCHRKARRRSQATRSAASSCSSGRGKVTRLEPMSRTGIERVPAAGRNAFACADSSPACCRSRHRRLPPRCSTSTGTPRTTWRRRFRASSRITTSRWRTSRACRGSAPATATSSATSTKRRTAA